MVRIFRLCFIKFIRGDVLNYLPLKCRATALPAASYISMLLLCIAFLNSWDGPFSRRELHLVAALMYITAMTPISFFVPSHLLFPVRRAVCYNRRPGSSTTNGFSTISLMACHVSVGP